MKTQISLLLLLTLCLSSCKEQDKQEYYAGFMLPDGALKTDFIKFTIKYANWQYGYDIDPDKAVNTMFAVDKKLFGGEGVMGNLTIREDSIIYSPQATYKYLFNGVTSYNIPIEDVVNAEIVEVDAVLMSKRLKINTKNGSIILLRCKKILADFYMSKVYDQEICDQINTLVKKH